MFPFIFIGRKGLTPLRVKTLINFFVKIQLVSQFGLSKLVWPVHQTDQTSLVQNYENLLNSITFVSGVHIMWSYAFWSSRWDLPIGVKFAFLWILTKPVWLVWHGMLDSANFSRQHVHFSINMYPALHKDFILRKRTNIPPFMYVRSTFWWEVVMSGRRSIRTMLNFS